MLRTMLVTASIAVLAGSTTTLAQNGKNGTSQGSTPNGRPFVAVQTQIDQLQVQLDALGPKINARIASIEELAAAVLALEARLAATDASLADLKLYHDAQDALIEQLKAKWEAAEAQLAQNTLSVQRLLQADQALNDLLGALQLDVDADAALLAALRAEVAEKQDAIDHICADGTFISAITSDGNVECKAAPAGGGAAGAGTLVVFDVVDAWQSAAVGSVASSMVQCPSGYQASGGGYLRDMQLSDVYYNAPFGNGWQVAAMNNAAVSRRIRAFVKCLKVE